MTKKLSVLDVQTMVASQKADSLAAMQSAQLSQDRAKAMDYYLGRMSNDMPVEEGRSEAVSTDVADVVEGMLPQLMDIFAGSDEAVRFEPVGPEDEQAAEQETDYVNHVFWNQNDGFQVLNGFFKDGLISKVGIVKVWWEETEKEEDETYYNLTEDQFAMVAQAVAQSDGDMEIVEHSEETKEVALLPGMPPQPMPFHDIKVKTTKKLAQAKVVGVPPEEFGIERTARSIRDCNYLFHEVVTKSEADLIDEGYDEDEIKAITEYNGLSEMETIERDTVLEHLAVTGGGGANPAARLVKITEHYVRMDYEGTGRPRWYLVITGGDQGNVLKKDKKDCIYPIDMPPFAAGIPIPQPHRFFGRSVADLVIPIQQQKTALKRGLLDNLYMHNNPRTEISESHAGENTLDDLLVSRPNGIVRTKMPGGLNPLVTVDITASVYPGLQYLDAELETRTGLTKQGQGIDANALQNQSATAVAQVFSASQMRMKLIARHFAEGVKDIFVLLHATIRKHGQQAQTVRLRNQWVNVDPRNWKTRNDLTIHVGLGNGSKAQQFAQTMAIGNLQKELLMGGKAHMVGDDKLFNMASEMTKIMGHKNVDRFFDDPTAKDPQTGQLLHPPAPPQPPPEVQIAQLKAQNDAQATQQKAALDQQKAQNDAQHQLVKTQAEIALEREKAELQAKLALIDAELKKDAANREAALHQLKMQHETERHQQDMQSKQIGLVATAQSHDAKMSAVQKKHEAESQKHKTEASRDLSPLVEKLTQHMEASSKPKKAKRQPDGSWVVEPIH